MAKLGFDYDLVVFGLKRVITSKDASVKGMIDAGLNGSSNPSTMAKLDDKFGGIEDSTEVQVDMLVFLIDDAISRIEAGLKTILPDDEERDSSIGGLVDMVHVMCFDLGFSEMIPVGFAEIPLLMQYILDKREGEAFTPEGVRKALNELIDKLNVRGVLEERGKVEELIANLSASLC